MQSFSQSLARGQILFSSWKNVDCAMSSRAGAEQDRYIRGIGKTGDGADSTPRLPKAPSIPPVQKKSIQKRGNIYLSLRHKRHVSKQTSQNPVGIPGDKPEVNPDREFESPSL